MEITHELLVYLSKTLGLFYFIAMSVGVIVYVYWPGHSQRFKQAAESILEDGENGDGENV